MESFIFVAAVVGCLILALAVRARSLRVTYDKLGQRYHGKVHRYGWWQAPGFVFIHDGSPVWLETARQGLRRRKATRLQFTWPHSQPDLRVVPRSFFAAILPFLRRSSIRVGAPNLRHSVYITGNPEDRAADLLNGSVQACLEQLLKLKGSRPIQVHLGNGALVISKRGAFRDLESLDSFLRLGCDLYDELRLVIAMEIEIVHERNATRCDDSVCQVCGEAIGRDIVYCNRCQTPHHRDCWKYVGTCSVYACGETRYLSRRKAERLLSESDIVD